MSVTTLLKVGVRSDMTRLRDAYVRSAHLVLQRSMARPRKGVLRAVLILVCERHGALEGLLLAVGRSEYLATAVVLWGGQSHRSKQHSNRKRCIQSKLNKPILNRFLVVRRKTYPAPFGHMPQETRMRAGAACTHSRSRGGVIVVSLFRFVAAVHEGRSLSWLLRQVEDAHNKGQPYCSCKSIHFLFKLQLCLPHRQG